MLVMAFRLSNGGEVHFPIAGQMAGFDEEETQDLYKVLSNKRLVKEGYMGVASFTAEGREIARELIETGEYPPPPADEQLLRDLGLTDNEIQDAAGSPDRVSVPTIEAAAKPSKIKKSWSILNAVVSHPVISAIIGSVIFGFICILLFKRTGLNLQDPSTSTKP